MECQDSLARRGKIWSGRRNRKNSHRLGEDEKQFWKTVVCPRVLLGILNWSFQLTAMGASGHKNNGFMENQCLRMRYTGMNLEAQ